MLVYQRVDACLKSPTQKTQRGRSQGLCGVPGVVVVTGSPGKKMALHYGLLRVMRDVWHTLEGRPARYQHVAGVWVASPRATPRLLAKRSLQVSMIHCILMDWIG
jgi:hypothetical protein